jgi:DNA-binding CsgD family transcriptional regulator
LVDLHLVDPVPGSDPSRFTVPESIRTFARAELAGLGETDAVERLRIRIRSRQAGAVAEGTESSHGEGGVRAIEADRDDLLDALSSALDHGLADDALDIARGLGAHWDLRGYGRLQEELLDRTLELGERAAGDPSKLANAMLWSGFLGLRHSASADPETLVGRIRQAEQIARLARDDTAIFHAQCVWLLVTPFSGDLVRAKEASEEGLHLAEVNRNPAWRSTIQVWAGMLANLTGDQEMAVQMGMAALEEARRSGDQETIVRVVMLLSPIADRFPDEVRGLPSTEQTIALTRELGLEFYEALLLVRMVHEALRRDGVDAAVEWMAQSLDIARTMLSSPVVGFDLMAMVHLAHALGDPDRAACFHGVVRDSLPVLERFMPEPQLVKHHAVLDSARAALGTDRFDMYEELGAALSWGDAVEEAITYVEGSRTSAGVEPASPSLDVTVQSENGLTARQTEVLRLLAAGLSNKEIAAALGVRAKTVMHHTTAIYRALGVRGRSEATAVAFRTGMVD